MLKIFFDASALFSALYSATGGSRQLIIFVKMEKIIGVTSQTVTEELEANIAKFKKISAISLQRLITDYRLLVTEKLTELEIGPFLGMVHPKDAHVIAGGILTGCNYLVTLDRKHLDNPSVKKKVGKIEILSPKEMLEVICGQK